MERAASGKLSVEFRDQQPPTRRCVISWQTCKFLIKVLEAETKTKRLGVFQKQLADLFDLLRRFCLLDLQPCDAANYPMSMPPFTLSTCPVM